MAFAFSLNGASGEAPGMGLRLLRGDPVETVLEGARALEPGGDLRLWTAPGSLGGWVSAEPGDDTERAARILYERVLRAAAGLRFYRFWNSVPRINENGPDGLERYRAFCRGRSLAFESEWGEGFSRELPASTAVGAQGGALVVGFLAGAAEPRHVENPSQVPAYRYPSEHGPRSPSFARATLVPRGGLADAYISGTSSIKGHQTVAPGDTEGQLACTLENLELISQACGLGSTLGADFPQAVRHVKIYLRNPGDLERVAEALEGPLVRPGDRVSYIGADICRLELNLEIEVAVRGLPRS